MCCQKMPVTGGRLTGAGIACPSRLTGSGIPAPVNRRLTGIPAGRYGTRSLVPGELFGVLTTTNRGAGRHTGVHKDN